MDFLKAIRPLNLCIVAATQLGIYYKFFWNRFPELELSLSPPLIWLFVLVTVLISACGYLINDYVDFDSDLVNRKAFRMTNKSKILPFYFILSTIGFLVSLYISIQVGQVLLVSIYFLATILLYLYSTHLKKHGLIGNIVVAIFAASVLLILIFAEKTFLSSYSEGGFIARILALFSAFVFLTNLIRELIKDIEDLDGDVIVGDRTFPVTNGVKNTRLLISGISILTIAILLIWIAPMNSSYQLIGLVFLILPLFFLLYNLFKFKTDFDAGFHSKLVKFIMISGLIIILIQ